MIVGQSQIDGLIQAEKRRRLTRRDSSQHGEHSCKEQKLPANKGQSRMAVQDGAIQPEPVASPALGFAGTPSKLRNSVDSFYFDQKHAQLIGLSLEHES